MASTGEVASFGADIHEAYWASLLSTNGFKVPQIGSGVLIGGDIACPQLATVAKGLSDLGFNLYCSSPVVESFLNDLPYLKHVERIFFPVKDKRKLRTVFEEYDIQSVINLAKFRGRDVLDEDYVARRSVHLSQFLISKLREILNGVETQSISVFPSSTIHSWLNSTSKRSARRFRRVN